MFRLLFYLLNLAVLTHATVTWTGSGGTSTTKATACPTGACVGIVSCTTGTTCNNTTESGLYDAIQALCFGDTLRLQSGHTFTGTNRAERASCGTAPNPITLTSTDMASLPNGDTRINAVYAPLMPVIRPSGSNQAALEFYDSPTPAEHWRISGIYGTMPYDQLGYLNSRGPFQIGMSGTHGGAPPAATTPGEQPNDIVFDRIIATQSFLSQMTRAVYAGSRALTVKNSIMDGGQNTGTDAQGFASFNGIGPYTLENNYVAGQGEGIFFGGSEPSLNSDEPVRWAKDVEIRYNYFTHNPHRWKMERWAPGYMVYRGRHLRSSNASGIVTAATVVNSSTCPTCSGGSGYTSAPTVTISGTGTGATATATVSGGAVTGVTITNPGIGYLAGATISFTGGGGTGAVGAVTVGIPTWLALNTGITGSTEPSWCNTINCTVTGPDGITWRMFSATGSNHLNKNLWEIKSAEDTIAEYNVFEYEWVDDQETAVNYKSENSQRSPYINQCAIGFEGTVNVDATGLIVTHSSGTFPDFAVTAGPRTVSAVDPTFNIVTISAAVGAGVVSQTALANTGVVFFGSDLPGGITAGVRYYTRNWVSYIQFQVSTTPDDTGIIDITSAGSGLTAGFEVSTGKMVNINGVWVIVSTFDSPTQLTLATAVTPTGGTPVVMYGGMRAGTAGSNTGCMPGINLNPIFQHNIIRNVSAAIKLTPGANSMNSRVTGYQIKNNLAYNIDGSLWDTDTGANNSADFLLSTSYPANNLVVEKNTMIGRVDLSSIIGEAGTPIVTPGNSVMRNNIFHGTVVNTFRTTSYTIGHISMAATLARGIAVVPTTQWDRNAFPGGTVSSFSVDPGVTLNLCPGAAANCIDTLFPSNYLKTNFTTRHASLDNQATDGTDIGVDVKKLPRIVNHQITVTDRAVFFDWDLSHNIQHIPCTVEVATTPDFEDAVQGALSGRGNTYAGELATIGSNPRIDADSHDRYPRWKSQRFAFIQGLTANTVYYWRQFCGGDARVGRDTPNTAYNTFTTMPTMSGTSTLSRRGTSMVAGYAYSRTTNTISSIVTPSCTGGICTATMNVGVPLYYSVNGSPVRVTTLKN